MNIDNINIVNYVIDIIKDNNSKVSLKDGYYICKKDSEKIVIDEEFTIISIE